MQNEDVDLEYRHSVRTGPVIALKDNDPELVFFNDLSTIQISKGKGFDFPEHLCKVFPIKQLMIFEIEELE